MCVSEILPQYLASFTIRCCCLLKFGGCPGLPIVVTIAFIKDSDRKRKKHERPNRSKDTVNAENLKTWKAEDSSEGITRVNFPTFRVDPEALEAINQYCKESGEGRAVLMRRLIREFLEARNQSA